MEFAPLVIASALVWKLVSFVKYLKAGDSNGVITQIVSWVAGVGVALLLAASDFAQGIEVGGHVLANLNNASLVLFGVALGSTASAAYDVKKSIDGSDSSSEPKLIA